MSKKATIIAVVNQKGGTGKTTTTENLGVGLALEGKKVLLVDTDPQASLTVSLGNPCPDDLSPTLSDLMGKIMMENPITPDEGILHHPEGVDLVPSNIELSGMEVALVNAMSRETILRQYLDTVKQNYDYILLDCMRKLSKYEKETIINWNEGETIASIYTFNASLKRRLEDFSRKYPLLCRLERSTPEGSVTYVMDKSRLSIRLVPPYSEERLAAARECAKEHGFQVIQTEEKIA